MTDTILDLLEQANPTKPGSRVEIGGARHYIAPDGDAYPSVTAILDIICPGWLHEVWRPRIAVHAAMDKIETLDEFYDPADVVEHALGAPERVMTAAGNRGTEVHLFAENFARGISTPKNQISNEAMPYIESFIKFVKEWRPEFLHTELRVFHRNRKYAGTLDTIMRIPDYGIVVGDWKTGKVVDKAPLQLAAYRYCTDAVTPGGDIVAMPRTDGGVVVHLRPNGYSLRPVSCGMDTEYLFRCALDLFNLKTDPQRLIHKTAAPPYKQPRKR